MTSTFHSLSPLRTVLRLNSFSCLVFGACFAAFPRSVNIYLAGTDRQHSVIAVLGYLLILNGMHLLLASFRRNIQRFEVVWFSLGDWIWVLATLILLLLNVLLTTLWGIVTSLTVSFLVFSFGLLQLSLLRLLGPHSVSVEVPFEGSAAAMWRALADFGNVDKFHPLVAKTELRSQQTCGLGAARHCWHRAGTEITETVVEWKDGEGFVVAHSDHKLPIRPDSTAGVWIIQRGETKLLRMEMNYVMKWGLLGVILGDTLMNLVARRELKKVVKGYIDGVRRYGLSRGLLPHQELGKS